MSDNEIINLYRPMIPFLAQVLGPSCEVLLHDVSRPDNSVVAIENGSQSGRAVGYPMTDLAHRVIETGEYKTRDSLVNYTSTGKGKCFISSTFFIKNEGRLIGLLCINRDMSVFSELEYALDRIKKQYNLATDAPDIQETLDTPVSVMLQNIVSSAIKDAGISTERMSIHEKVAVVHKLADQGVLGMKGSVAEIACQLQISEPTVYRYINRNR